AALCETLDISLCVQLEPCFGDPEVKIFESSGKMSSFEQCAGYPAIYILQFKRTSHMPRPSLRPQEDGSISAVRNSIFALGPQERISGPLLLSNAQIEEIGEITCADEDADCVNSE